jgi:hypothetical protein
MAVVVVLHSIAVVALPTSYQERGKKKGGRERGEIRK